MNSIDILPNELLLKIFQIILYCTGWDSVFKLRAVSKRWKAVAERTLALANELTLCGYRIYCFFQPKFSELCFLKL